MLFRHITAKRSIQTADLQFDPTESAPVAGRDFQAFGGHILAAEVGTGSLEVTIIAHDKELERKVDPEIGANVLQLPGE